MLLLGALMISNVKYPRFPAAGFRTPAQLGGLTIYLVMLAGGLTIPHYFLFLLGISYVVFGIARAVVMNLSERSDDRGDDEHRPMALVPPAHRARRGRRNWKHGE